MEVVQKPAIEKSIGGNREAFVHPARAGHPRPISPENIAPVSRPEASRAITKRPSASALALNRRTNSASSSADIPSATPSGSEWLNASPISCAISSRSWSSRTIADSAKIYQWIHVAVSIMVLPEKSTSVSDIPYPKTNLANSMAPASIQRNSAQDAGP
jgi:hypothetical protein